MAGKPKLGQNFLHDRQAIERIVSALGEISNRTVVEIGPGRGAITELLAERAGRLIAVELDNVLAAGLEHRFGEKLTVRRQDVLRFDFTTAAAEAGGKLLVVGNLPYYITSGRGCGGDRTGGSDDAAGGGRSCDSGAGFAGVWAADCGDAALWENPIALYAAAGGFFAATGCLFNCLSLEFCAAHCGAGCRGKEFSGVGEAVLSAEAKDAWE